MIIIKCHFSYPKEPLCDAQVPLYTCKRAPFFIYKQYSISINYIYACYKLYVYGC